jgi:hypothetical protein
MSGVSQAVVMLTLARECEKSLPKNKRQDSIKESWRLF